MNPNSGSWYPSCVIKMTIRYDESLQVAGTGEAVTTKAISARTQESRIVATVGQATGEPLQPRRPRRGVVEHTATIGVPTGQSMNEAIAEQNAALSQLDDFRPNADSQFETPGAGSVSSRSGAAVTRGPNSETVPLVWGTDGFTVIANRVPKKGSFTLPHPRSAATFTMSFDFHEFPVDPRLIRAVGLEIHVGAVSAEDYARGMAGEKDSNGRPLSILKTTADVVDPTTKRYGPNKATLLFYATADTWEVDHSDKGSFITIQGRDIRGIFIDAKVPLAKIAKLDLTKPINVVVEDIIKTMGVDQDLRMSVMTDAAEWPSGQIPSPGDAAGLTRVRLGASGSKTSGTPASGSKTSYWDLITNYCTLVGAMPTLVGSTLWIRPNRRIFDIVDKRSGIATPFAGGEPRMVGSEKIRARRLVYGRDVRRLRIERKFAGAVVPTIQTISFDDRAQGGQRLIFGQWPPSASDTAKAKSEQEMLRVPIWGIRSVDQLNEIAHGIYEEIGRGETGGVAETSNLASFGGDNADPDLLRLRPLEPVEFVVDATALRTVAPVVTELIESERRTFSEEVDILHRRLGDRAVARVLVAMARGAVRELIAFYQVIGVQYDWDNGYRISMQFQNYIVPRHKAKAVTDVQRKPDLRHSRVEVVGAHKKAKIVATVGKATAVPLQAEPSYDGDGQGSRASPAPGGYKLTGRYRRLGDEQ